AQDRHINPAFQRLQTCLPAQPGIQHAQLLPELSNLIHSQLCVADAEAEAAKHAGQWRERPIALPVVLDTGIRQDVERNLQPDPLQVTDRETELGTHEHRMAYEMVAGRTVLGQNSPSRVVASVGSQGTAGCAAFT